mmetsp:Transcript_6847/g.21227  ORF Transcript_6847/g.21227 Transcript_6847/m.21227 type:complete len:219 (-) Transcript_6847:252-908(-)
MDEEGGGDGEDGEEQDDGEGHFLEGARERAEVEVLDELVDDDGADEEFGDAHENAGSPGQREEDPGQAAARAQEVDRDLLVGRPGDLEQNHGRKGREVHGPDAVGPLAVQSRKHSEEEIGNEALRRLVVGVHDGVHERRPEVPNHEKPGAVEARDALPDQSRPHPAGLRDEVQQRHRAVREDEVQRKHHAPRTRQRGNRQDPEPQRHRTQSRARLEKE